MASGMPLSLKRIAEAGRLATRLGKEVWLSDDVGFRGTGRLVARVRASSVRLYFRWTTPDARRVHEPLGPFSHPAKAGCLTLAQGRAKALLLSATRVVSPRPNAPFDVVVDATSTTNSSALAEEATTDSGAQNAPTLWDVCNNYVAYLKEQGKASAGGVESTLRKYVMGIELATYPAHLITTAQLADLVRPIVQAGHNATARQVRSYLGTAYSVAMSGDDDPNAPAGVGIESLKINPAAKMKKVKGTVGTRERALSEEELHILLLRLASFGKLNRVRGLAARACRLLIYLGGQRGQQLLSCKASALDLTRTPPTLTIFDPKGKKDGRVRVHVIPVEGFVLEELKWFLERSQAMNSIWLFCSIDPAKHLLQRAMSDEVKELAREMRKNPAVTPAQFQYSDLRRTAETLMVPLGIGDATRGRLLSHGLSSVQNKHYNRWKYMGEMREGLRRWHAFLMTLEGLPDLPTTGTHLLP